MPSFDWKKEIEQIKRSINLLLPPTPEVLVIDDDPDDMCLACRELEKFHCNTTICHDPQEAVKKMGERHFDIVFLDLIMPKVNGLEVMQTAVGLSPGTHFILVTGYPASPFVDETIRMGAVLAAKPITEQTLKLFLRRKDE